MNGRSTRSGWAFVAFPLAVVFLFTALPTAAGVVLSFFVWNGSDAPSFIGLGNFQAAMTKDPQFWYAMRNTLFFAAVTVPITTVLAFLFAVILNARWFVGRTAVRTMFFLPAVVSIIAVGYVWRWVLDPKAGLLNATLEWAHLDALFGGDLPAWLGDNPWGLGAMILVQIWRNLGFCVVLYLAALSQVPKSLHEAASVDGAGPWQSIWCVTWPCVRPMTAFLIITGSIWALQVFDLVWGIWGEAQMRWTDVLNAHLYREFTHLRLSYSATIGVCMLLLTAVVTIAQIRWMKRSEEADR